MDCHGVLSEDFTGLPMIYMEVRIEFVVSSSDKHDEHDVLDNVKYLGLNPYLKPCVW